MRAPYAALVLLAALLAGCATSDRPARSNRVETDPLRAEAAAVLVALIDDDVPCSEVFARMETDGETQSAYCAELPAYRAEVSDLVLGETVDSDGSFAIIRVRVDFRDGRPSIPDSEIEVNVVDGRPRVALGMP